MKLTLGAAAILLLIPCSNEGRALVARGPFRGFLARVAPGVELELVAKLATAQLGDRWIIDLTPLPDTILIRENGNGPNVDASDVSAAVVWEQSHRMRAAGTFQWVEPAFAAPLLLEATQQQEPPGECSPEWHGDWGDRIDDPEARADSQWSLSHDRGADVIDAWDLFQKRVPGAGIYVGHPDTGFFEHPAILPALLRPGFSFVERRSPAADATEQGVLQWQGHGTRTSSVIAGKRGFKVSPESTHAISGVAYGARIMPLRVANRVVMFQELDLDMANLAIAVHGAAIGDSNFVAHPADVISMSLGGAPSRAMADALDVAEHHNVIVLAAAGNDVPKREVVYPARYDNVIAVAAVNARSKPWTGSSRGPAVAFSAPGENVWTARELIDSDTAHHCVEMGTGASYAVATSAGVAALWLSYNKSKLSDVGDLAGTFRRLARDNVRKVPSDSSVSPPWSWSSKEFGPGVIDAKGLLTAPITEASSMAPICPDLRGLQSVLGPDYPDGAAKLLFGRPVHDCSQLQTGVGDELTYGFATDGAIFTVFTNELHSRDAGTIARLRAALLRLRLSDTARRTLASATVGTMTSLGEVR